MKALGRHLLLELKSCDPGILDDLSFIRGALIEAAEDAGAKIVGESFHKFQPHGVTGLVAIAESHICIHTWPEHGYAAADVFTCGEDFDPGEAAKILIEKLRCSNPSTREFPRGLLSQQETSAAV